VDGLYKAVASCMIPTNESLQERAGKHQARRQEILIEMARLRVVGEIWIAKEKTRLPGSDASLAGAFCSGT
jgi:hypothetical protein